VYPRLRSLIAGAPCALAVVVALTACGGGGGSSNAPATNVRGSSFRFQAPGDWKVTRATNQVSARPKPAASELVSVSVFPLVRTYTDSLYQLEVSKELDPYARQLAARQKGKLVGSKDVKVAGIRSRQYELRYPQGDRQLAERITFVFRGKTEYELLCQWDASKSEPDFCGQLTSTFTPT
jgi:hypothetical protein